jgi:hypothetical protein
MGVGSNIAFFSGAVPEDAIVTDWVNRTIAAGGSISTKSRTAHDTFVQGLKADGIWTKMSSGLIMPFASNGWVGAIEPLIAPTGSTFNPILLDASNYSLLGGIDPGAANLEPKRIATSINAQTIFTTANAQCSVYRPIHRLGRDSVINTINGSDTYSRLQFHASWEDGMTIFDAFDFESTGGRISATLLSNAGFITGRRDANGLAIMRNAIVQASNTNPSGNTIPLQNINLLGQFDSAFSFYSRSTTTYIYAGSSLTNAEELQHYNRVQALQTSLGRQV